MKRLLLVIVLTVSVPALAGSFFPLLPGATWTFANDTGAIWTFDLGHPVLWHGALCHPRVEIAGAFVGRSYWSEDADGHVLLNGLEYLTGDGGVWYFDPPAVYLDPGLLPGEQFVSQAGVYEVTESGDQWYGLQTVTLTCLDRDPVTTPFGTYPAIAVSPAWDAPGAAPWPYGRDAVQVYGWSIGPARFYRTDVADQDFRLIDLDGLQPADATPAAAALALAAAPNPFNPQTILGFTLDQPGHVRLEVFDLAGRRIATLVDRELTAGAHSVPWQPGNQGSGVYVARLTTAAGTVTARLALLK